MEIGPLLALLAALSFAANLVAVRRGIVLGGKSSTATSVSVFTGALAYLLILPVTGDYRQFDAVSWSALGGLATAGIINFCLSRYLFFSCVKLIGANRATAIGRTDIIFAAFFGIVFFRETLTTTLVLGSLGIMFGAILVNLVKEKACTNFRPARRYPGADFFPLRSNLITAGEVGNERGRLALRGNIYLLRCRGDSLGNYPRRQSTAKSGRADPQPPAAGDVYTYRRFRDDGAPLPLLGAGAESSQRHPAAVWHRGPVHLVSFLPHQPQD